MSDDDRFSWRYATLAEARTLECNRCGDCCDSRRLPKPTDWGWADLPENGYAEFNDGEPLIVELSPGATRGFRCARLEPQADGTALCGLHDEPRPPTCIGFPIRFDDFDEVGAAYEVHTGPLTRCTWYGMVLLPEGDDILDWRDTDWRVEWEALTAEQKVELNAAHVAMRSDRTAEVVK